MGITNNQGKSEREEAERICCKVKMDDVKLILEVEKPRRFVRMSS